MISLDDRDRITLPKKIREKIKFRRYIISLEGDIVQLVPVPDPRDAKASVEIPWSLEDLEESQEKYVGKRESV